MKIRIKLFFIYTLICLFHATQAIAQTQPENKSLHDVLEAVEKRFNIQFNYAEDVIAEIFIPQIPENSSLDNILNHLESNTGLSFSQLNEEIILIKLKTQQTICGFIKSAVDNQVIPLATIQNGNKGLVANSAGYFESLNLKNTDSLEIRALGFKTHIIYLNNQDLSHCLTIYLDPEVQALSEVFISNYITKGISKLNNGSFNINIEEFEILPGLIDADVLNSVQAFPGILSVSETVSNINIRGGSHDQNLILWDNIKMYQSGHFFGLISMYNPQITQNVSLFKNGTDVAFTDGVSGTIAMYTEKKLNNSFKGNLGLNLIDANGFADVPLGKKSSLQLAARKSISDFTKTPTYDQFFKRISQNNELQNDINSDKEFDFYDASLRWIYKINESNELRLNFINVSNNLVFNENGIINAAETSRESSVSQSSIAGGLQYERQWNSKFNTTLEIYETDYKLEAINSNVTESQRFLQKNQVSETSVKLIAGKKINQKLNAFLGYHFTETEVTNLDDVDVPRYKLLISEVLREHSLFTGINLKTLNKKTHVDFGFRYAFIDKFQEHLFEPRMSITHKLSSNLSIEALAELKHQNTSQIINFQNDFLGVEKRRWQLTDNDSIPIIKSKQVSIGINYDKLNFLISAEGYYKKVKGITSQSQGFQNNFEFIKTSGSYEVYGLDLLLRKRINDFNLWLSYSFMDNKYFFQNLYETEFPSNFDIRHAVTFGSSYAINKFKFAAGFNWRTGKPISTPVQANEIVDNELNYDQPNSTTLKSYIRVDLSALYYVNLGAKLKGQFGASIWNVLGDENMINRYYRVNNAKLVEINELSLGFVPNVSARLIF